MVNEERLRHMIKLSQFDKNDGKQCKPMAQYARKDYVSLHMIISFLSGSVAYVLIFVLWALYSIDGLFQTINKMGIEGALTALVVGYLIFMVLYLGATYIVFNVKYTWGRGQVKKFYTSVKQVNQMYEREERLRVTGGSADWE